MICGKKTIIFNNRPVISTRYLSFVRQRLLLKAQIGLDFTTQIQKRRQFGVSVAPPPNAHARWRCCMLKNGTYIDYNNLQ